MYKYIGFGLTGLILLMVMPSALDAQMNNGLDLYGAATLVKQDSDGNEVFKQTIHNRLVDTGEIFMLGGTFADGTTEGDTTSIGAICVSDGTVIDTETVTAAAFDLARTFGSGSSCIDADEGVATGVGGTAVLGALTFQATTHVPVAGTINSIAVCQANGAGINTFAGCSNAGADILFATIATSAVTLNAGESVDITYTFDITSSQN